MPRRCAVIGAGAWGLPAAAELARRGRHVTLVDRWGAATVWGSSPGATRIWRLAHPDRLRVRLGQRAVEAWQRREARSGVECIRRTGLLWRDTDYDDVAAALTAEGVDPGDVGRWYPGMRASSNAAVWQPDAGIVLAAQSMGACEADFLASGGVTRYGTRVVGIEVRATDLVLQCDDGNDVVADQVVVAAGPWAQELLASLDIDLPLLAVLHQVSYVGGTAEERLPCVIDGELDGDDTWLFGLPTPGRGLKIGLEILPRILDPAADDRDREPVPALETLVADRISRQLPGIDPKVTGSEVCTYAMSPDSRFVIDTACDGRVVLACGDSGEGFKFSALMGEVVADLADGQPPPADIASFSLARFDGRPPVPVQPRLLGH